MRPRLWFPARFGADPTDRFKVPVVEGFGGDGGGTSSGTSSGGGDGKASSSSSSSSSDASTSQKKLNRYLDYLAQLGLSNNALTTKLAKQAVAGGHSTAWFVTQVRNKDPRYLKTTDFKNRIAAIASAWESQMGASTPMPRKWALSKALSAMPMNQAAVIRAIRKMPQFKQATRGLNLDLMTPAEYRQWSAAYDQISLNTTGHRLTPQEKFIMFSNNLAPGDYEKALVMTKSGQTAYNVMQGRGMTAEEMKRSIFGGAGQTALLSRLQGAGQMAQSLASSRPAGYDLARREEDQRLKMTGI